MIYSGVLLAALAVERQGANGTIIFFVQMILIFAVFYWLMIRPQRKEQQRLQERISAIQKGDEVVTAGGIVGKIKHVEDSRVTLTSGDSSLVVERSRIVQVLTEPKE